VNDNLPPSLNRFAAELERAIRREDSRRDRRLGRVLLARPRLLAGTTVGAAGTGAVLALVLSAAGSSPAFAVTRNRDGSYSVTLRSLRAIPAANAKLARMGVPARFVPVRATCTNAIAGGPSTARLRGAWQNVRPSAAQSVKVSARSLPRNELLMIAAWRQARQVKVASSISGAAAACVPPCPPAGARAKAVRVQVPIAAGALSPGNSGNSGNSGSGNSGSGAVWSTTQPPAKSVHAAPQKWVQINCPAPPPGAGDSGNSGNSGNSGSRNGGNSGNS
jgi:hypothetical protein